MTGTKQNGGKKKIQNPKASKALTDLGEIELLFLEKLIKKTHVLLLRFQWLVWSPCEMPHAFFGTSRSQVCQVENKNEMVLGFGTSDVSKTVGVNFSRIRIYRMYIYI